MRQQLQMLPNLEKSLHHYLSRHFVMIDNGSSKALVYSSSIGIDVSQTADFSKSNNPD
jgi:hypothetical protein